MIGTDLNGENNSAITGFDKSSMGTISKKPRRFCFQVLFRSISRAAITFTAITQL
jgi:hypothetical protein